MPPTNPPTFSFRRLIKAVARELSPTWFSKREGARLRSTRDSLARELLEDHRARRASRRRWDDVEFRRFDAASQTPRTSGWMAPQTSPDGTVATLIDRLRQRSRDLGRNNSHARKAVRALAVHTVGVGIRATLEHPDDVVRDRAQKLWDGWAESTECDADGRTNFYGLQRQVVRNVHEAGEVLSRMRLRRLSDGLSVPLQIQLVEIDLLDSRRDTSFMGATAGEEKNAIAGVEFDARGRRRGYWLFPAHPARSSQGYGTSVFVPADTVGHHFETLRPGQVRGIPRGASCLMGLRDLGDWADATILRTKLAACYTAFITRDGDPADPDAEDATPTGKDIEELEPGMIEYLRVGESVTLTDPPGVEGMEHFAKMTLESIAVGFDVPAWILTGNLSDVNLSTAKIAGLEFEAGLEADRSDWLIPQFCRLVFDWFYRQAKIAGLLPEGITVSWTPPPIALYEPLKELEAAKARIRNGLSTPPEEQKKAGWRPHELLAETAAFWKKVDELELKFDTDPRQAAAGTPTSSPQKSEDKPADKTGDKPPAGGAKEETDDESEDPKTGDVAKGEAK